ncbi:MAG: Hsp70 family protein [Myxococcales bacterium]
MRRSLLALLLVAACKKDARPPSLGEAISVEQPGGSATTLFSQGSEIPTSATEGFTTGHDGDKRILIHVLRGGGKTATALHSDGWWSVDGITGARAGEPRVQVTLEVDNQGQLSLSAREEDHKLAVRKIEKGADKLAASPLTEPDDDEDTDEDPE